MSKIRRWLDSRQSAKGSSPVGDASSAELFSAIKTELGQDAVDALRKKLSDNVPFVIRKFSVDTSELEFVEKYLTVPEYRREKLASMSSNFHRTLLDKSVREYAHFAGDLISDMTLGDLSKAIEKKDWSKLVNKTDEDAPLAVDYKPHIQQFPVHSKYTSQILESSAKIPNHNYAEAGTGSKIVHETPDKYLFMTKPYHKKIESKTRSWVKHPITGWATMATKALFNAGKIGHLAEDVSAHEHEGVPVTVHKFAQNHHMYRGIKSRPNESVDPSDIHKIAVMDFLTNNLDRHRGNLMIGNHTQANGFKPILAIDHERNFQYQKPMAFMSGGPSLEGYEDMQTETPWAYLRGSPALKSYHSSQNWSSHEGLVDWWNEHGQKIKDEMENQLGSIKDESVRKHVRDNFNDRWHKMNDWSRDMSQHPESDDMYLPQSLGSRFVPSRIIKQEQPRISSKQLRSLPKNKKDALSAISDIINRKERLTPKQRYLLSDAIKNTVESMTPEESGDIFRSVVDNPYMSTKPIKSDPELDAKNVMLRHFSQFQHQTPEPYKYAHMESIANAIDDLPSEKKEILKHWADHYRRLLAEREKKVA
jgi:hypothetical protein